MKVLIISHESDLDGLFSAIGLIRYPQARTVFSRLWEENFETMGQFVHKFIDSSLSDRKRD